MKGMVLAAGTAALLTVVAAQAEGEWAPPSASLRASMKPPAGDWTRSLSPPFSHPSADPTPFEDDAGIEAGAGAEEDENEDLDVVDAHWMALTMWGEARGQGEEAMRAVGHVILNRRAGGRHGAFVTDAVSAPYQFSCWNDGDPNQAAIMAVDRLNPGSVDHRMWSAARRIAAEVLSGRSTDPTHGALFYHVEGIAPAWSVGIAPVARIGGHLFFATAR